MSLRALKHEVGILQQVLNPKPKYDIKKASEISELLVQYEELITQFKRNLETEGFTPKQINAQLQLTDQATTDQILENYEAIEAQIRKG
jgi:hypothetical protein